MQEMMASEAANNATANQDQPSETPANQAAESVEPSNEIEEPASGRGQESAGTSNQETAGASALSASAQAQSNTVNNAAPSSSLSSLSNLSAGCLECGLDPVGAIKAAKQLENVAKKQESASNSGDHNLASNTLGERTWSPNYFTLKSAADVITVLKIPQNSPNRSNYWKFYWK